MEHASLQLIQHDSAVKKRQEMKKSVDYEAI